MNTSYAVTSRPGGLVGCKPSKNPFSRRGSDSGAAAAATRRSFGEASPFRPPAPRKLRYEQLGSVPESNRIRSDICQQQLRQYASGHGKILSADDVSVRRKAGP
jgi:hypothetical protein